MPVMDMFWGDRFGQVRDPFGHLWSLATHKEDVSPEEMARRMASMPPPKPAKQKAAARPARKRSAPKKARAKAGKRRR